MHVLIFSYETARHADIVFAGSLQEEEEGTVTTAEGRVTRIRKVVDPLERLVRICRLFKS